MSQQPSLDTWTSGFLFAVAMGVFLFVVLMGSRNRRNYAIAFLVLSFSSILFSYVMFWTGYSLVLPYFNDFHFIGFYAIGPLLYMYLLSFNTMKMRFVKYHFAPFLLLVFLTIVKWVQHVFDFKVYGGEVHVLISNYVLISAHLIFYLVMMLKLFKRYYEVKTEYQKIHDTWIKALIALYGFFLFSYISYYILINFTFFSLKWDYMIALSMSITIYTIGYFVYKRPQILDGEFFTSLFLQKQNQEKSFEDKLITESYNSLVKFIEENKPFKDNELRLAHLADKVGYSTHLLSKIINVKSGKNFNNFINDFRLLEAEKLLTSENNFNIKTIYFDVGFNNKVSFYRAFKEKYNCTPLEYKKSKYL